MSTKVGVSDFVNVMFVDEFSMVGEDDYDSIKSIYQLDESENKVPIKVVWIGDLNQLPPVKSKLSLVPHGNFCLHLTEVFRQSSDNPLMIPLNQLVSYIEGNKPKPLTESDKFVRGVGDLQQVYKGCNTDKVLLAYTNKAVQDANFNIQGVDYPDAHNSNLYSPTTRHSYEYISTTPPEYVVCCKPAFGENLVLNSKYRTLEFLVSQKLCDFMELYDIELDYSDTYPVIFGTYNYKVIKDKLGEEAIIANNKIKYEFKVTDASEWAKSNRGHPRERERALAWRRYMSMKNVLCLDFNHAMTIHKSQGSTYNTVFLDSNDLAVCKDKGDYMMYMKLFYVAISRASNKVITN